MALSQSPALIWASHAFASIITGFGINAFIRPAHALTFFEFTPPASPADRRMVDSLMAVYGIRDVFIGAAIESALLFGTRKSLGWVLLSFGMVAFVDGLVCFSHGKGQWHHWSYAPMVTALGSILVGALDF